MFPRPPLGGFSAKYAGAYLLPPTVKPKKKKKVQTDEESLDELAKTAAAQDALDEQRMIMRRRLQAGDLGGGWNPFTSTSFDN
jgi:hypothetical protein